MKLSKNDIAALVVMAVWLVGGGALACVAASTMKFEAACFFLPVVILMLLLTTPMAGLACYPMPTPRSILGCVDSGVQRRKGGRK